MNMTQAKAMLEAYRIAACEGSKAADQIGRAIVDAMVGVECYPVTTNPTYPAPQEAWTHVTIGGATVKPLVRDGSIGYEYCGTVETGAEDGE